MNVKHGDGLPPPTHRPPATELELRRLIDALETETYFTRWLDLQLGRLGRLPPIPPGKA